MSKLLIKAKAGNGRIAHVTPENAGWTYVGFDLYRLSEGDVIEANTGDQEVCLVTISGAGKFSADGADFGVLGGRTSPFDGLPAAVYLPANTPYHVQAVGDLELAICLAPAQGGGHGVRVIGSDDLEQEVRGQGTNVRYVTNILPENHAADSLLVVEVITPGGHTSSYPPHKHDTDNLPHESLLEETYYHRIKPSQGFAFQRVYNDDRTLDEVMTIEDGDVVLVPEGYHPCAACHGYDLYYLNVMAGPKRTWRFHNAPEHEWLLKA